MNKTTRKRIAKEVQRINRAFENNYFLPVYRSLNHQTPALIAVIRAQGVAAGMAWLRQQVINPRVAVTIRNLYRTVGVKHANRVYGMLDSEPMQQKRFGFNAEWAQLVAEYLRKFLLDKITFQVTENQREALLKVLNKGIEEGLGVDEMVKRLQDTDGWPKILRYRTARIVRTEIKRAAEVGAKVASDEFEYEQNKEWIAITDIRTRGVEANDHADHYHMDGQVVDADGKFIDPRNGHELAFPGDPSAAAEDTINCRCTSAYVAKRDQNGRMIPKVKAQSRVNVIRPGEFVRRGPVVTV